MYATDFEYDGQLLSDFGFIICRFGASSGIVTASTGSNITFNKVSRNKGRDFSLVYTQYDKCIQTTFDICKNPDVYDNPYMEITNDEYKGMMRWLNRHEFLKFQILDNDGRDACYYNASFNIEKITVSDILYGLRLTMETDRPFGFGKTITASHIFTDITKPFNLTAYSDEISSILPMVTITCTGDGDIALHNETEDCTMLIKNCMAGEVITIDSKNQMFSTSYDSHDIANDFNYEFFRISNSYAFKINKIYASAQCKIEIKYEPVIKDAP